MRKFIVASIVGLFIIAMSSSAMAGHRINVTCNTNNPAGNELTRSLINSLSRYGHTITQNQPDYIAVVHAANNNGQTVFSVVWLSASWSYVNNWFGTVPYGYRMSENTDYFAREGLQQMLGR